MGIFKDKERQIIDVKHFSDFTAFQRPKDKCIGQYTEEYVTYDEWRYKDEITTTQYCPEFQKKYGCDKTDCPGYKKYCEYINAKRDYEKAEHESLSYPLWVIIGALFQRNSH